MLGLERIFLPMPDRNPAIAEAMGCTLPSLYRRTFADILNRDADIAVQDIDFERYFFEIALEGLTSNFGTNSSIRKVSRKAGAYRSAFLDALPMERIVVHGALHPLNQIQPKARFSSEAGIGVVQRSALLGAAIDPARQAEAGAHVPVSPADLGAYVDGLSSALFGAAGSRPLTAAARRRSGVLAGREFILEEGVTLTCGISSDQRRRSLNLVDPAMIVRGADGEVVDLRPEFVADMWPGLQAYYRCPTEGEMLNAVRAVFTFLRFGLVAFQD